MLDPIGHTTLSQLDVKHTTLSELMSKSICHTTVGQNVQLLWEQPNFVSIVAHARSCRIHHNVRGDVKVYLSYDSGTKHTLAMIAD